MQNMRYIDVANMTVVTHSTLPSYQVISGSHNYQQERERQEKREESARTLSSHL
jgi:hypothetical protein